MVRGVPYCEIHQRDAYQYADDKRKADPHRYQSNLFYNSKRWKLMRNLCLARNPLCAMCGALAEVVDHIDHNWRNNPADGSNHQSLCTSCHNRKTAQDAAGKSQRNPPGDAKNTVY